ncbi:MAG: NapC/NirT family cytochrome c [Pseudomonadota bacterium]|nr:NapC/NirT family cytochrome c [Pseudomonadota bacterium]
MAERKPVTSTKKKLAWGTLLIGVLLGILFWGGFNTALRVTNTETFCISCHEMEENVYEEYTNTIHYTNRTGVRATCPDCHVPKEWEHKLVRKIRATNELYHHFMGTVDTPEKFESKRFELASNVWRSMKATDSRECRNCHGYDFMDFDKQEGRAADQHEEMEAGYDEDSEDHKAAAEAGLTCIDCHKGVAHSLPAEYDPEKDAPGESIYYAEPD